MTIVVVDEAEGVVVIFGRETKGVFEVEIASGDGRGVDGSGNGTKGGVIIVRSDTIARFKVHHLRHILIAVKGIEEFVASRIGEHEERACGHGFGWVPSKEVK